MKELLWGTRPEEEGGPPPEPLAFGTYDPFAPVEPSETLDLRGFIQVLTNARALTRVRERVDWRFGIGRWTRSRHKPLLFENVKEYPEHRVFTNGLVNSNCIALALGFSAGVPIGKVIAEAKKRLREPIAPKMVGAGPVMENVVPSSVIDLAQFPVPQWSERDSGRALGTWHLNVSKDPETGRSHAGIYRMKLLGPKQATVNASRRSALARQLAKAEAKKVELPMAVVIGAPEATVIAAAAAPPAKMGAFELAGALQQQAVELFQCGHLEVPAHAEIVIEGFIHPGVRVENGSFVEHGRVKTNPKAFLFEATRLLYRDSPIFRGSASRPEGAEDQQVYAFLEQLKLTPSNGSLFRQMFPGLFS
jgi:UbiD family decarboxylase